jgi:indolepyruvate ferredoxin oxidoreductase
VAGSAKSLAAISPGETHAIINTHETYPGSFTTNPDYSLPTRRILQAISARAGAEKTRLVEATRIATALMGDAIATNMFMLGLAYQAGTIPLSHEAIERAIELNGVDVAMNKAAFAWGRRAAIEPDAVAAIAEGRLRPREPISQSLDDIIVRRVRFLTEYQNSRYAERYAATVNRVREAEARITRGRADLTEAVARNLFKLMAVKDEYEVARLYTDGSFMAQLSGEFASYDKLEFHLAPPIFARRDKATGHLQKGTYGPWMMRAFRFLARMKLVRGTILDPFGRTPERRMERKLVAHYEALLGLILDRLTPANQMLAVALASYPEKIRGFGHVKAESAVRATAEATIRREAFLAGPVTAEAAE